MKNAKLSDRDLAKKIGSSQPTVTRTRKKLEKKGYIKEYTIILNFEKLGFKLMAMTLSNSKNCLPPKKLKRQRRSLLHAPEKAQG